MPRHRQLRWVLPQLRHHHRAVLSSASNSSELNEYVPLVQEVSKGDGISDKRWSVLFVCLGASCALAPKTTCMPLSSAKLSVVTLKRYEYLDLHSSLQCAQEIYAGAPQQRQFSERL